MEYKECTKCKISKPIDEFSWRSKKINRRTSNCKICHRKMKNSYYNGKNPKEKLKIQERKDKIKKWFVDLKSSLSCERCGEDNIATIQFHHKNPEEKELEISRVIRNGWSQDRILKEIEKCEVLCANCHCKEHFYTDL